MAKQTSDIISTTIDENFPVAGQDNDSQGFRDNFSIFKNNFAAAKAEMDELLVNAARKDVNNNFNGLDIIDANLNRVTENVFPIGSISSASDIEYTNGHYQTLRVTSDANSVVTRILTLTEWPESGRYARVAVQMTGDQGANPANVEFRATGTGKIFYETNFPQTISLQSTSDAKIVEFWTIDGGLNVFARYLGEYAER
jgi:hypothetical protein